MNHDKCEHPCNFAYKIIIYRGVCYIQHVFDMLFIIATSLLAGLLPKFTKENFFRGGVMLKISKNASSEGGGKLKKSYGSDLYGKLYLR